MSLLVRQRGEAYRLRDGGKIAAEQFGTLQQGSPLLEWGSITKTVTARIAEQLDHTGTLDLSAPVSVYLPAAKLPREVDGAHSPRTHLGCRDFPKASSPTRPKRSIRARSAPLLTFDTKMLPRLAEQRSGTVGSFDYLTMRAYRCGVDQCPVGACQTSSRAIAFTPRTAPGASTEVTAHLVWSECALAGRIEA